VLADSIRWTCAFAALSDAWQPSLSWPSERTRLCRPMHEPDDYPARPRQRQSGRTLPPRVLEVLRVLREIGGSVRIEYIDRKTGCTNVETTRRHLQLLVARGLVRRVSHLFWQATT
jgi:hypothetical protein